MGAALIDVVIFGAAVASVMALRSLLRPAAAVNHPVEHEYRTARQIVERHGEDSSHWLGVALDSLAAQAHGRHG